MNINLTMPSQPFQVGLPSIPNFDIDALVSVVGASIDGTDRSNIPDGTMKVCVLTSFDGNSKLRVNLMSSADFEAAAGEPMLYFANCGQVYTTPPQCSELVAAYKAYQSQPDDESRASWLGGQGAIPQNVEDPSNAEVTIQFVAATVPAPAMDDAA